MRLIAHEAGVAQALLHYHFNTKERLFEAIFARRSTAINAFREERLDKLLAGDNNPTLEDLLDVLFQPVRIFSAARRNRERTLRLWSLRSRLDKTSGRSR